MGVTGDVQVNFKIGRKIFIHTKVCDTVCGQLILSSRVKSMFLHITLKVGYNSRKFGMTLSGRNYIMCRSILAAASREKA